MNQIPISNSNSFLGFVPSMVIQHLHEKSIRQEKTKLPEKQSLKSVVMFADISGFTNLTETLSKKGPEGAEIIAFAINRYMELMVKEIGRSGGDIFKFAGDAMIVVWPPPKQEGLLQNSCRQAVQAALSIQSKLDNMNITDGVKLSVKIGFGVGDFSIIYVGGIFGRAEYLAAGDPLTQAFSAEHEAESGGVINCSQQVHDLIKEHFEIVVKNADHKIYQVKKVKEKVMVKADAMMIKDKMKSSDIEKIKTGVLQYVPRSLQAYIQFEQEQWSSELRMATIIFMNIGIDLSDCADQEGLKKIQRVIEGIQKCVYMYEGSLNKFLMDDKGSTLIVVFGLPPITHQDDAVRAVLCSYAIKKQLKKQNCKCSIGIGTGLVFAGVVGTSGNRREYSVIGDSVNLSARIMQKACYEKDDQFKILCSETTMKQAQNKISFKYKESCLFKGKSMELPIYYPLDLSDREINDLDRENKFPSLRTHLFSFSMDQDLTDKENQKKKNKFFLSMEGRKKEIYECKHLLQQFIEQNDSSTPHKGCLIISGEMGIGKSLLLRQVIYEIQEAINKPIKKMAYKYNERPQILVSNLDPSNKFKKMNIMRSILQKIIHIIEQRVIDGEKEKTSIKIKNFIESRKFQQEILRPESELQENQDEQIEYYDPKIPLDKIINDFNEICGITEYNYVENFPPPFNTLKEDDFLSRHKEEMKKLSALAMEIFSLYFDQPLSRRKNSIVSTSSIDLSTMKKSSFEKVAPLVLVLEDLQYADAISFRVIGDLLYQFNRVYVVGAMRSSQLEKPSFPNPFLPSQEVLNQKSIQRIIKCLTNSEQEFNYNNSHDSDNTTRLFRQIDIKGLTLKEISNIINGVYNLESFAYIEKKEGSQENYNGSQNTGGNVNSQSEQNNHNNQQQTAKQRSDREKEILKKIDNYEKDNFSYLFFSKIKYDLALLPDRFFLNFLYFKTQGNPLMALHIIENLIKQKLLIIKDENFLQKVQKEVDELHTFYNYDELDTKKGYITQHLKKAILLEDLITIDVPLCKYNVNTPIQDKLGCLDLLILKVASVIGDIFDLQTLSKVHPFGNVLKPDKLVEALNTLNEQNVLEVIDQNDNNVFYRFCNSFVRETLYQRLIYTQRRQIHLIVAENLQNQLSLPYNQDEDIEKLKYQWLLGENTVIKIKKNQYSLQYICLHHRKIQTIQTYYKNLDQKKINLRYLLIFLIKQKDISITNLPHKAKRSIIVKKIQSQLTTSSSSASTIIKEDMLSKKSDFSKLSWSKRYLIMSTKDIRYYYTKEDSKYKPEEFLGAIPLRFIYEVNMLDPKEYGRKDYPFIIKASTWYKKAKQQEKRDFYFACSTKEEYEEWYIYLNIAKTKALQDEFHREYGKVTILKGGLDIDVTLKNFIEQKRAQANSKAEPNKKNRRNTMSGSSILNKKSKEKNKQEVSNEVYNQNQMMAQDALKKDVEQFIKRGMIMFFGHLFAQSVHLDGIDLFGEATPKAYSKVNFSKVNKTHSSNYRSQNSLSQKASVDLDNTLTSQLNPQLLTAHMPSIEPDANGNKKRVTIMKGVTSENNSPSHRPRGPDQGKRKSILTTNRVNNINSVGIVDSNNFLTPQAQDVTLLNLSDNKSGGNQSGNTTQRNNEEQDQSSKNKNNTQIILNKISYENPQSENSQQGSSTAASQNTYNNNTITLSNNYEFPPNEKVEKVKSSSKPQSLSSKSTTASQPPSLPAQVRKELESIPQQSREQSIEYLNGIQVSPIQRSTTPQGQKTESDQQNSDRRRMMDQSDQSPPNRKSISPHGQGNNTNRQQYQPVKGVNGNITDLKRSSTQSTLPINQNMYSNNTNSYYISNANNGSYNQTNDGKNFSLLLVESNNRGSINSSPSINPFPSSMLGQNNFQLQNENSARNHYQNSMDMSHFRNQFDDNNNSMYHQNQFNNSQIRHPENGYMMSRRQNESFNDEDLRNRNQSSNISTNANDLQRRINSVSSKSPFKYDHLDRADKKSISISSINNYSADQVYKAKALTSAQSIKGDLNIEVGKEYNVTISKNNNSYVNIVENNKQGTFKRSMFNFIDNKNLNTFTLNQYSNNNNPNMEESYIQRYNKEFDEQQMNNSSSYYDNRSSNSFSMDNKLLSNNAPSYVYQKQNEFTATKQSLKNNMTQYY